MQILPEFANPNEAGALRPSHSLLARVVVPGAGLNHRQADFRSVFGGFYRLMNQPLVALAEADARRSTTASHKTVKKAISLPADLAAEA
jgi:hypothetical protein